MNSIYRIIKLDDFGDVISGVEIDHDISINSNTLKCIRIELPSDFKCTININCRNLSKLVISDSDEAKINLGNNILEELTCYFKVSDDNDDYELYRPMRYICDNYKYLFNNNYPMTIQNKCYLSEEELMEDINEEYYIYEDARGWWTNIYDKDTKEFICSM